MKKYKYGLTGKGFTLEEADEILRDLPPLNPMSKEEYEEYLAKLEKSADDFKAELEANGECDDVPVTRADLERFWEEQRSQGANSGGVTIRNEESSVPASPPGSS